MKNKVLKSLFSIILAIFSIFGISHIKTYSFYFYPFLFLLLFLLFYFFFFKKQDKRKVIYALLFSFLLSFFQIIGYHCFKFDSTHLNQLNTYFYILSLLPIIYLITISIFNFSFNTKENHSKLLDFIFNHKYSYLIIFIMIILAWFPILISFYPGNFSYDAATQLRMVQNHVITKYHPVIHTLFLGKTILLGRNLFSSFSLGIFLYSSIQIVIMASIFTYMITYLHKKGVPNWLCFIFILVFMFLPTHSIFSFTTTKDILFSGIFCLVIIKVIEMSHYPKVFFTSKKQIITTIILIFLLLIFRNNMIYAFVFFLPYALVVSRKYSKKILLIIICSLILYSSYQVILTFGFKIKNGPRVEAFSVIIQQLARTYNKENLNSKEKKLIEELFSNDSLKNYHSHISDPVKSSFQTDVFLLNQHTYIKLYLSLFKKYPLTYIDSFFDTVYPYFYLDDVLPDKGARTYIEITCLDSDELNRTYICHQNVKPIYQLYNHLVNDATYQKNPLLNLLMNMANYVWLLIFTCCYLLATKKYSSFIPVLLLFSLFLTNLLGPVAIVRYIYPIMVCAPLLIYLIITNKKVLD